MAIKLDGLTSLTACGHQVRVGSVKVAGNPG
jgi:hypothetical protein